jgi:hypothetical protein
VSPSPSRQILQHRIVEHGIRQEPLDFAIPVFEALRAAGIQHFYAVMFGLQLVGNRPVSSQSFGTTQIKEG